MFAPTTAIQYLAAIHLHVESKERHTMNFFAEQILTHRLLKLKVSKGQRLGFGEWAGSLGWKCYKIWLWLSLYNYKCNKIHWVKKIKKQKLKKVVHIYIYNGNYSAMKRNKIMLFAATCMDLEILILSEASQKEKDKYCMI